MRIEEADTYQSMSYTKRFIVMLYLLQTAQSVPVVNQTTSVPVKNYTTTIPDNSVTSQTTQVTSQTSQTASEAMTNTTTTQQTSTVADPTTKSVQVTVKPSTKASRPTCGKILRKLQRNPPLHTKIIGPGKRRGQSSFKIRYRCNVGTKMDNGKKQATRKCINGRIIGKSVKCKPIVCGKPPPVPHATYRGKNFSYRGRVVYRCNKEYKMEGRSWRSCKFNGKWTKKPRCTSTRCPLKKLPRIAHGTVNTTDPEFKHGTTLLFSCNHGYELARNDKAIECNEGKWTRPLRYIPYCKAIKCPDPTKYHNNGRYNGLNFRVNATVEFFCYAGLKLLGSRKRTCQANKLWSGSTTVCDTGNTYCPNPGTPISGKKIGHRYNFGSIVRFKCDEGYVLIGSSVRRCMPNRRWNGTETVCMAEFEYMTRNTRNTAAILKQNLDRMLEYTCSGINSTCNMTNVDLRARAINPKHAGGLDIVFVFDASSSINKLDFKLGIRFAQELVKQLGSTWKPGGTHVAALTYGTKPQMEFNLGDASTDSADKVIRQLDKIDRLGGGTASQPALDMVKTLVVPQTREGSQKTLFFITDGRSNIGGSPRKAAAYLREKKDFEIYAVGVGKQVRHRELMSIASHPEDKHVLVVKDYGELPKMVRQAVDIKIDYTPCGVSPTSFRARMVGGNKAGRGTWPWQVGIHNLNLKGNLALKCGGALIGKQWVLTAGHCFYGINEITKKTERQIIPPSIYTVKVGDYHLKVKEPAQVDLEAEAIYIHQSYRHHPFFENDIALIKLREEVKLGPFVRTVCLPKKGENLLQPGNHGYVAGWGATQVLQRGQDALPNKVNSQVLLHSAFKVQSNVTCKDATKEFFNPSVTFCAGDGKGGNDTCTGDSGGSFVRESKQSDGKWRWVSTGLVSWGEGCGLKNKYGYYTRVEPFVNWIKETIQKDREESEK